MKISCTRENLHQGLSVTSHLMNKGVNLPILQNVLIKAEGGIIKFTATNLEMAVSCLVRGKVEEGGEYTAPSKLLFDYVALLPNETIQLTTEDSFLRLHCGHHKTKINGVAASEFPLIPTIEVQKQFRLPAQEFRRALNQIIFAVALNESRPELTGVVLNFIKGDKPRLVLAATDSYRLGEKTIILPEAIKNEGKVIIPAKALVEIGRILAVFKDDVDAPSEIIMNLSENQAVFSYGSVELISRVIEGNYPDYKQIIPKDFATSLEVDKEDLIKAVKAASLFAKNGLFDITLGIDAANNKMNVRAIDSQRGENIAECIAEVKGGDNSVTVNYRYLLDGLNAIPTEKICFEMIDAANPCVLRPNTDKEAYLYIVMPIKQ